MTITLTELGAIGELLGAVAVLLTLLYLAVQVRHGRELLERNEKLALGQAFQARVDSRRDIEKLVIDLADIVIRLQAGEFEDLTPAEQLKARQLCSLWADHWDNNVYQSSLGFTSAMNEEVTASQFDYVREMWATAGITPSRRVSEWYDQKKREEGI